MLVTAFVLSALLNCCVVTLVTATKTGKQHPDAVVARKFSRGFEGLSNTEGKGYELIGQTQGGRSEYYLSNYTTDRESALNHCSRYRSPNGRKVTLLVIDSDEETNYITNYLRNSNLNCVWIAANLLSVNNSEQLVTFGGRAGVRSIDVSGRTRREKRFSLLQKRVKKAAGIGTYTITLQEIMYPYVNRTGPDGKPCSLVPNCKPLECTVKTPQCEIIHDGNCQLDRKGNCSVWDVGKCTVSNNTQCTVPKPCCNLVQKPCNITSHKKCKISQPNCTVIPPVCTTTRPPCISRQPACNVRLPIDNPLCNEEECTSTTPSPEMCTPPTPNCTTNAQGRLVCKPFIVPDICNKVKPVCLRPRYCLTPMIICPPPETFCPPPVTNCTLPQVSCGQPILNCTDPKVFCPKPELNCTVPKPSCIPPKVTCGSVVATCETPALKCAPPRVVCGVPEVNCDQPEPCELLGPDNCPPALECHDGCQCVKLSRNADFGWESCDCDEQCNVICEG